MSYSCGIVGLPNVGKSTLFNAISRSRAPAEDFPFCTIEPNLGRIRVKDPRLDELAAIVKPRALEPLHLPIVDIAGLVKNAAKGEGLGNRFLAHIRETDVLLHTVRCFPSPSTGAPATPLEDIAIIETELMLADLESLQKRRDKLRRDRKAPKDSQASSLAIETALIDSLIELLGAGRSARGLAVDGDEAAAALAQLNLLSAKPVMFICNLDVSDSASVGKGGHELVEQVRAYSRDSFGEGAAPVCAVCAQYEAEIAELPEAEQSLFIADLGWSESGLDGVVRSANALLGRLCFFTAGEKEVRAWSAPKGSDARECAGRIHTDFARGFIAAAVVGYQDFIDCGGWRGAQEKGRQSLEGAHYLVADGDVIHFRFNV